MKHVIWVIDLNNKVYVEKGKMYNYGLAIY